MFFRFNENDDDDGLIYMVDGAKKVNFSAPPVPPPTGVTPALVVGYLDATGVRQWASVVNGVTNINGVAPFFVEFYAGDSVSEQLDSDTPAKAFWDLGFVLDYGDNRAGNWPVSGRPRATDRGMPIFARAYLESGIYTPRLYCRDSAGNQSFISLTINVNDPDAGVNMVSGVLPAFTSNTVYNAPAGGTWPNITSHLNGLRNILIRKVGVGADPVFGTVTLDGRNEPNVVITRSAGIRFLNCDVANVVWGNVGFDYCAFIGGRVRALNIPNMNYAANEIFAQSRTELQAQNVRMARGLLLQSTGTLGGSNAPGYNIIGEMRGLHMIDMVSEKNTAAQHNMRGIYAYSSIRHCQFINTVSGSVSYNKFQGWNCSGVGNLPDPWPENDMVVNYGEVRVLGLPSTRVAVVDCVFGGPGGVTPTANAGFGPENNVFGDPAQGCELSGYEYCVWYQTANWYTLDLSGRYLGRRDCRLNMGAGGEVSVAAGTNHVNRTPPGWGVYYISGTRPVPVLP